MAINKLVLIIMAVSFLGLAGCKSLDQVTKKYDKVKYNDGVNMEEAKAVAQNSILASPYTSAYDVFHPQVVLDSSSEKYRNLWFITFPARDAASPYEHIVVIDKNTGGIVRSSQYQASLQKGFDWLFK